MTGAPPTTSDCHKPLPGDPGIGSTDLFGDDEMGAGPRRGPRIKTRERMCLDLMAWMLMDHHGTLDDYRAVMAGQTPCPRHKHCPKYKKARAAGKRFAWDSPNAGSERT